MLVAPTALAWEWCGGFVGKEITFQVDDPYLEVRLVLRDAVTGQEFPELEAIFHSETGPGSQCDHRVWVKSTQPEWQPYTLYNVEFYDANTDNEPPFYSFNYFGCQESGSFSDSNFYCPYGGVENPDLAVVIRYKNHDPKLDPEVLLAPLKYTNVLGAADTGIADYFTDENWMAPYNLDVVNAALGTNETLDISFFLTGQEGPPYTTTADTDLVLPANPNVNNWDGTYDWAEVHHGWQPGTRTLKFPAGRGLVVEGDLIAEDVTLTTSGPIIDDRAQTPWDGVAVYSGGSLSLNDVTVQYAETGVTVYSDDVTITNSAIQNNDVGIESGLVRNYCPGGSPCPSGGLSSFTLEGTEVADNSGIGILARNAEDIEMRESNEANTWIHDNDGDGLYLWNATVTQFLDTFVEGNDGIGANVLDNADLSFTDLSDPESQPPGLDRVANNGSHELFVSGGGNLFLGEGTAGGSNDVYDDTAVGPGNRLIYNEQPCSGMLCGERTVDAEHTWWGSASGPPSGAFEGGPVNADSPLMNPATSGSRPASPVIAEVGGTAGRGDGAWLGEAIREARRSLDEAPGAEGAGALVRRLYGLQRLDPDDTLGEHGPTMAVLSVLRARLSQGQLAGPLRAAAEAALVAEVHDAIRLGVYDEADGLLGAFAEAVEGPEARRSLALSRVMVAEHAGQYEEALAVLGGVMAEMDAEDPMQGALAVVAEALAEGTGGEGRPGGSSLAGTLHDVQAVRASGDVLGVPYPNPSAGAAVVPLVLEEAAEVEVSVYDVLGRAVATLAEGHVEAGSHRLAFDASALPAGIYVVRAEVDGGRTFTQRLTVIR